MHWGFSAERSDVSSSSRYFCPRHTLNTPWGAVPPSLRNTGLELRFNKVPPAAARPQCTHASLWIVFQARLQLVFFSSSACYLLLPSVSVYNAPLPSAPHAEQFYCFHKFCMIHIRSSLFPYRSDALPDLLSLVVYEQCQAGRVMHRHTTQSSQRLLLRVEDVLSFMS